MDARLIVAIMYSENELRDMVLEILKARFGEPSSCSSEFSFTYTKYYEKEFGSDLKKAFYCFGAIDPGELAELKLYAISLEKELSDGGRRRVNIDPGYMTVDSLILASTKPRPYRIYLCKGIYAQLNWIFRKKDIIRFTWTLPDYEEHLEFFRKIREEMLHS